MVLASQSATDIMKDKNGKVSGAPFWTEPEVNAKDLCNQLIFFLSKKIFFLVFLRDILANSSIFSYFYMIQVSILSLFFH